MGSRKRSLSFSDSLLRALRSTCACLSLEQVLAAGTVSAGARGGKVSTLDVSRALSVDPFIFSLTSLSKPPARLRPLSLSKKSPKKAHLPLPC